jgi:tetratricopeptide (TPR) repeat protein
MIGIARMREMRETVIRLSGLASSVAAALFIAWLLYAQPKTMADVRGGLAASVGLYEIDRVAFDEGLQFFRAGHLPEARLAFERADPAARDAVTQFYIAYSFYRQGWGRLYSDDELFRQALKALDRAVAASPDGRVLVEDAQLGLQSSDALRAELERGLTRELSDFNPMRWLRKRP